MLKEWVEWEAFFFVVVSFHLRHQKEELRATNLSFRSQLLANYVYEDVDGLLRHSMTRLLLLFPPSKDLAGPARHPFSRLSQTCLHQGHALIHRCCLDFEPLSVSQ
jgi:hypothetical protein